MGRIFSDAVEQALEYIYYRDRDQRGREGFALLEQASAEGDGDASCVLARCLSGDGYVWNGHGFPEDGRRAVKLLHQSVAQGSALGVLVALRSQELTPSVQKKMPFASLKEAFDIVLEKAELGDAFCQYTIGNTYFWWDFQRIQDKGRDSFPSEAAYKSYLRENISQCEGWFLRAYQGGMHLAGNNLNHYYTKGDEDIIPPQPEKAKNIWKMGAEYGYPVQQYNYAKQLDAAGDKAGAFEWFRKSSEGGERYAWFYLGRAYEQGEGTEKDARRAVQCYERMLSYGMEPATANRLGAMYFNGEGVERDYAKAFQLISRAYAHGSDWGVYYLGTMYFYGRGVQQDYVKAREILEKVDWNNKEVHYCLGVIYGQGLGVAADIPKAVDHLQKAGGFQPAKEELLRYRKTLFGKWVRR